MLGSKSKFLFKCSFETRLRFRILRIIKMRFSKWRGKCENSIYSSLTFLDNLPHETHAESRSEIDKPLSIQMYSTYLFITLLCSKYAVVCPDILHTLGAGGNRSEISTFYFCISFWEKVQVFSYINILIDKKFSQFQSVVFFFRGL